MRKRGVLVSVVLMLGALSLSPGHAAALTPIVPVLTGPGSYFSPLQEGPLSVGFQPPVVVAPLNATILLVHADIAPHNIVSVATTCDTLTMPNGLGQPGIDAQGNDIPCSGTSHPERWDMSYCPYIAGAPAGWTEGQPIDNAWKSSHACPLVYNFTIGLGQTKSYSLLFDGVPKVDVEKTYEFYCEVHVNMRGLLVVAPPAG
jgi:hypothetical protein